MTGIVLVDDQEMYRIGLRRILAARSDLAVVAEAGDGVGAVRAVEAGGVDLVLMDLRMPGLDGVEATRRIRAEHPSSAVRILVLTTFDEDQHVLAALRAGANGFLSKGVGPMELLAAIDEVMAGGGSLSSSAARALIDHVVHQTPPVPVDPALQDRFASLTARERDVVVAVAQGKDNTTIGVELFISPYTVKTHANRAMAKLGARDRAQLVTMAYRVGLMTGR